MLRIELTYDWMCDMSSRVDTINNNKSIVVALVHNINFVIRLLKTHSFR